MEGTEFPGKRKKNVVVWKKKINNFFKNEGKIISSAFVDVQ